MTALYRFMMGHDIWPTLSLLTDLTFPIQIILTRDGVLLLVVNNGLVQNSDRP
jgi:hypothetical protein